jgi:tetratricopeptide (TPR) repeat protein
MVDGVQREPAAGLSFEESADSEGSSLAGEPAIAIKPWDPQTPYLAKLRAAPPEKRFACYLEERRAWRESPAFFLDCGDLFLAGKERERALQIYSNLAELDLEDAPLLRVLAHRLAQVGELELGIMLFEEVLRLRPEEPQSFRDLALVLAERAEKRASLLGEEERGQARADFARALELLAEVIMGSWDRFPEIEVIALMELNRLLPKAKAAGLDRIPVDDRLVRLLDVDIRIVLTWDVDGTDIDLWVVEPSGEKAYYEHPATTIGGRVSRDATDGYGPEEYVLKKGMHGVYAIEVNFYGSAAAEMIGAVTLQLDIVTNFGRPTEKRSTVTRRLIKEKESIRIGEIEF